MEWNMAISLCSLSLQCFDTVGGRQEGHPACKKTGCWFVGGDDLTGARFIAPVVTTTSIILCFNKHRLTLENGR